MFILNGRLNGDKDENFTRKNTSVVDFWVSNVSFVSSLKTLNVLDCFKLLSNVHCPLSITLHATDIHDNEFQICDQEREEKIKSWDNEKLEFQNNINHDT